MIILFIRSIFVFKPLQKFIFLSEAVTSHGYCLSCREKLANENYVYRHLINTCIVLIGWPYFTTTIMPVNRSVLKGLNNVLIFIGYSSLSRIKSIESYGIEFL